MTTISKCWKSVLYSSLAIVVWGACGASAGESIESRIGDICMGQGDRIPHDLSRERIIALGEGGRKALLRMAKDNPCALHWLVELEDERVVEIIRRLVTNRKTSGSMRAVALSAAASTKDVSLLQYAREVFRSESAVLSQGYRTESMDLVDAATALLGAVGEQGDLTMLRETYVNGQFRGSPLILWNAIARKGNEEAIDVFVAEVARLDLARREDLRSDLIVAMTKIGTTRGRREAMAEMEKFHDPWIRRSTAEAVYGILSKQRTESRSAQETSEIDGCLPILQEQAKQ